MRRSVKLAHFLPLSGRCEPKEGDLEDADNHVVKPEAWKPVERSLTQDLVRLAKDGVLDAKGSGARLQISRRSFYAWQGREVPVVPV